MSDEETIEISFIYFKDTGKYYTDGKQTFLKTDFPIGCVYPSQYGRHLRSERKLPGLESGHWDGPFMVDAGYPELVLPEKGPTE